MHRPGLSFRTVFFWPSVHDRNYFYKVAILTHKNGQIGLWATSARKSSIYILQYVMNPRGGGGPRPSRIFNVIYSGVAILEHEIMVLDELSDFS